MNYVKLMADYCSSGLWNKAGANMDPSEVPLSEALKDRIELWCGWYEKNPGYLEPKEKAKGYPEYFFDIAAFSREGRLIAKEIRKELPASWTVEYCNEEKLENAMVKGRPERHEFIETY